MNSRFPVLRLENLANTDHRYADRAVEWHPISRRVIIHVFERPMLVESLDDSEIVALLRTAGISGDTTTSLVPGQFCIVHNRPVYGAYSGPFKIFLDITTFCRLHCSFCLSAASSVNPIFMPLDFIERVAHEARLAGVMFAKIGGGEPTLHPNFLQILSLLHDAGVHVTTSINSSICSHEILDSFRKYGVGVSVSLSGLRSTDERLTGSPGHFNRTINLAESLRNFGVNVKLRTTLLRENLQEVPQLVSLASKLKIKIKFSYCRPAGRAAINSSLLDSNDAPIYIRTIDYLNRPDILPHVILDEGMTYQQDPALIKWQGNGNACGAGRRSMHIDPTGTVSPCVFLGKEFTVRKITSIIDYWRGESPELSAARNIPIPSECSSCHRLCKNECPATRLYHHGAFDAGSDPNCLLSAQEVVKELEQGASLM